MSDCAEIAARVLAEREAAAITGLLDTLRSIAEDGSEHEPKPQKGADRDPLLAYEDGHADAAYLAAEKAREALADWEAR